MNRVRFAVVTLILCAVLPALALGQPAPNPDPAGPPADIQKDIMVVPADTTAPEAPAQRPAPAAVPIPAPVGGYGEISAHAALQTLYQWSQEDRAAGNEKVERFLTRRVILALDYRPNERTSFYMSFDFLEGDLIDRADEDFEGRLRDAWIDLALTQYLFLRAGSFRPPWTLNLDDEPSQEIFVRYPLLVSNNPFTPWRQTGIMASGRLGENLSVDVGLWNGLDDPERTNETNNMKDTMVSIRLTPYPGFDLHVGHWGGKTKTDTISPVLPAGGVGENKNTWVALTMDRGAWYFGWESIWNQMDAEDNVSDSKAYGYQFMLAYTYRIVQPTLRYEYFDPNTGADADELEWTTVGLNLHLAPALRIMTNYIFKAERLDNQYSNDELLVQASLAF